jgi:hypothetical protein
VRHVGAISLHWPAPDCSFCICSGCSAFMDVCCCFAKTETVLLLFPVAMHVGNYQESSDTPFLCYNTAPGPAAAVARQTAAQWACADTPTDNSSFSYAPRFAFCRSCIPIMCCAAVVLVAYPLPDRVVSSQLLCRLNLPKPCSLPRLLSIICTVWKAARSAPAWLFLVHCTLPACSHRAHMQ